MDIKKDRAKHLEAIKMVEERKATSQRRETEMKLAKQKKETEIRVKKARERAEQYKKLVKCLPNHNAFNSEAINLSCAL